MASTIRSFAKTEGQAPMPSRGKDSDTDDVNAEGQGSFFEGTAPLHVGHRSDFVTVSAKAGRRRCPTMSF